MDSPVEGVRCADFVNCPLSVVGFLMGAERPLEPTQAVFPNEWPGDCLLPVQLVTGLPSSGS